MGKWPEKMEPFGTIGGMDAVDRLTQQTQRQTWMFDGAVPPPSKAQIAMVLHALADHTSLVQAVRWAPDPDFEPEATSVGRWLHAYGDECRWRAQDEGLLEPGVQEQLKLLAIARAVSNQDRAGSWRNEGDRRLVGLAEAGQRLLDLERGNEGE